MSGDAASGKHGARRAYAMRHTRRIGPGYLATIGSAVRRVRPYAVACAIKIRSKGSLMEMRQRSGKNRMHARDRKFEIRTCKHFYSKLSRIDIEIIAATAIFDRDFPKARRAEPSLVSGIAYQISGRFGQSGRILRSPKQQVSIQQQPHVPPSNSRAISSSHIRSKSSGTLIRPFMNPIGLISRGADASNETTLTSGLPALAMMKGSPLAAFSMSRDKCVLA
jgi:hypothetical protein